MSEIQLRGQGVLAGKGARQFNRTVGRYSAQSELTRQRIDLATDEAMDKVASTTALTGTMLSDVTRVCQALRSFEALVPEASGRLSMIADNHVLGLMSLEAEHRRDLNRL